MMLLLDSHVLLWLLRGNPRLGPDARALIAEAATVHVSVASILELTMKRMLGKLTINDNFVARLLEQGLVPLSITAEHAEGVRYFPELAKHDPFDRILMAQAQRAGLRLLTADRVLLSLERDFVLDATL